MHFYILTRKLNKKKVSRKSLYAFTAFYSISKLSFLIELFLLLSKMLPEQRLSTIAFHPV